MGEWQRAEPPRPWAVEEDTDRIPERRGDQIAFRPERTARLEGKTPAKPMLFGTVGMAKRYQRASSRGIRTSTYERAPTYLHGVPVEVAIAAHLRRLRIRHFIVQEPDPSRRSTQSCSSRSVSESENVTQVIDRALSARSARIMSVALRVVSMR